MSKSLNRMFLVMLEVALIVKLTEEVDPLEGALPLPVQPVQRYWFPVPPLTGELTLSAFAATTVLLTTVMLLSFVTAPSVSAKNVPMPFSIVNINGQLSICHHPPQPCSQFTATLEAHAKGPITGVMGTLLISSGHGEPEPPDPCIAPVTGFISDPTAVESVTLNGKLHQPDCSGLRR